MRTLLSCLIVIGFFSVLTLMLLKGIDADNNQSVFMLIGTMGTAFGIVIQYYFGSSAGSEQKSALLAQSTPTPAVPTGIPKPAVPPQPSATTQGVKQP